MERDKQKKKERKSDLIVDAPDHVKKIPEVRSRGGSRNCVRVALEVVVVVVVCSVLHDAHLRRDSSSDS